MSSLAGTDLNYAFAYDFDPKQSVTQPTKQINRRDELPPKKMENFVDTQSINQSAPLDPNFLTSDQKLHLLSNELQKHKEHFEQQKKNSYLDKLLSKKKDIMKLLIISFIFLFAISLHGVIDYYLKKFFEENIMGAGKEFIFRMLYPVTVLLVLWNIKVFSK